jgi:hypothetical protein
LGKRLLYYDRFTGIAHYSDYDASTGRGIHLYEGDSEANLEHAKTLRNDTEAAKYGIKHDMQQVAHVPPMVIVELRTKYGIDLYTNPKEALSIIRRDYPACLTVEKKAIGG